MKFTEERLSDTIGCIGKIFMFTFYGFNVYLKIFFLLKRVTAVLLSGEKFQKKKKDLIPNSKNKPRGIVVFNVVLGSMKIIWSVGQYTGIW